MKNAIDKYKQSKKKEEQRRATGTAPAGLDDLFQIGERQVANRNLTADDVKQMTDAQIEMIYARGALSANELLKERETIEKLRSIGETDPDNSPYGRMDGNFKSEWIRQYALIKKLVKIKTEEIEIGDSKIPVVELDGQFPPFFDERVNNVDMYNYVCGYSTWQVGAPVGFDKSGKSELIKANSYPELKKYSFHRGSIEVINSLDELFQYIKSGTPIPRELYPYKMVDGQKVYIDTEILREVSMPILINMLKLEGLARNLTEGPADWNTKFIAIDQLYMVVNLTVGRGNWFLAVSEPHKVIQQTDKKGVVEYWVCRGYYIDKLGTFQYGQIDAQCRFGGNDEARKAAIKQLMARKLFMSVFRAFKSTNKEETQKIIAFINAVNARDVGMITRQVRNEGIEFRKRMIHTNEEHESKRLMPSAENDLDMDITKPLDLSTNEKEVSDPVRGGVRIENASQHIGDVENPEIPKNVEPMPDMKEPIIAEKTQEAQEHQKEKQYEPAVTEPMDEDIMADIEKYI